MKNSVRLLTFLSFSIALCTASAGDITGTISLKGTPAPEKPLPLDALCAKANTSMPKTRFYVVGSKGELADVVVSLKGITGKSAGASAPAAILDQVGCEYTPYILAIQTNQKLTVKNSDPVLHNVHPMPIAPGNKEDNKAQIAGGPPLNFTFPTPENHLKFMCNVHFWMFSYVSVFDHPYFAVSGKDGTFKIANVPPGKYTLEVNHRKGGVLTKEIEVKDGTVTQDFTVDAK